MFSSRLCCALWGTFLVYLLCYESYGAIFARSFHCGLAYLALRLPLAVYRVPCVPGLGFTIAAFHGCTASFSLRRLSPIRRPARMPSGNREASSPAARRPSRKGYNAHTYLG
jgi:hypothetical protein